MKIKSIGTTAIEEARLIKEDNTEEIIKQGMMISYHKDKSEDGELNLNLSFINLEDKELNELIWALQQFLLPEEED